MSQLDRLFYNGGEYVRADEAVRQVSERNARIAELEAKNARLREALVDHNGLLRSAFTAAQRDAIHDVKGTTNYRLLADRSLEVLTKHHEITNEARQALGDHDD